MKMERQGIMASAYPLKVSSAQTRELYSPLVWLVEFSIISPCLGKVEVLPITPT